MSSKMMIGKIVITLFPYYNTLKKRYAYKARPALIIAHFPYEDDEYVVLPIATLKRKEFYHPQFDYPLTQQQCDLLGLNELCYIRCHKQTTINKDMISREIGDLKQNCTLIYKEVIKIMQEYDRIKARL